MRSSVVVFVRNDVAPHIAAREPHELAPEERGDFFTDLLRAGEALERAYAADKINYQILGNLVPHLHAHIQPRFTATRTRVNQ